MSNATTRVDKASNPLTAGYQDNIWSSYSAQRSSPTFNPVASRPAATLSNAAPATNPWGQVPSRTTSDNSLPNKPRHGHTASSSFLEGANRGAQGRGFAPMYSSKPARDEEKENIGFMHTVPGSLNMHQRRSSHAQNLQSFSGLGAVGAPPSRDGSVPPSRHSDGSSQHPSPPSVTPAATYSTMSNATYSTRRPDPLNPSATERHRTQASFDMADRPAPGPVNPFVASAFTAPSGQLGPLVNVMEGLPQTGPPPPFLTRMYNNGSDASYLGQATNPMHMQDHTAALPPAIYHRLAAQGLSAAPMPDAAAVWEFLAQQPQAYANNPYQYAGFQPYQMYQHPQHQQHRYQQPASHSQDADKGSMSQVLLDFRASKGGPRWELKSIYGHIVEFSGDQQGSRHIQKALETANGDEKEKVFQEVLPNAVQMMKDLFGNYVIQKLFEHGSMPQKRVLAAQMKGKIFDLSNQMYACRVVQKAFQHVLVEQQAELVRELAPNALQTIQDQNGNHVIQKVLESVDPSLTGFIYEAVTGQVARLSNHMFGCRVIQRMLEFGNTEQKAAVLEEILPATPSMLTDAYGNYVVQHVIGLANDHYSAEMIRLILRCNVFTLSRHKHASNIIEECIKKGTAADRSNILKQLTDPANDPNPLLTLMKDQFANYVLQKLLDGMDDGPERQKLVKDMNAHFVTLKATLSGRQAQTVERLINATEGVKSPRRSRSRSGRANNDNSNVSRRSSTLRVDVNSSTPTPVLTMEQNSPQSSSPPSTNSSALGDSGVAGVAADGKAFMGAFSSLQLQDNDEEHESVGLVGGRY
ncbi:pumilio domain-containing protein [Plectosphaerella plurivora]|uniref:Pumilio domain-containing protein n=1 Tax=Plectosphaerella plurivora TaxID=936078 RepID=A0A9P8VJF0_9PEZI|nr:pumilio domain-containing protein [Plectosphaerella plurivora]